MKVVMSVIARPVQAPRKAVVSAIARPVEIPR